MKTNRALVAGNIQRLQSLLSLGSVVIQLLQSAVKAALQFFRRRRLEVVYKNHKDPTDKRGKLRPTFTRFCLKASRNTGEVTFEDCPFLATRNFIPFESISGLLRELVCIVGSTVKLQCKQPLSRKFLRAKLCYFQSSLIQGNRNSNKDCRYRPNRLHPSRCSPFIPYKSIQPIPADGIKPQQGKHQRGRNNKPDRDDKWAKLPFVITPFLRNHHRLLDYLNSGSLPAAKPLVHGGAA